MYYYIARSPNSFLVFSMPVIALGSEYQDFNLVFANPLGNPIEASTIRWELKTLIEENDLLPVVFRSFRHSFITYKLKLNGGDVKSVHGDSGHAQTKMVTDPI